MKTVKMSVKELKGLTLFKAISSTGKEATFQIKGEVAVNVETGKEMKLDTLRRSWEIVVEEVSAEITPVVEAPKYVEGNYYNIAGLKYRYSGGHFYHGNFSLWKDDAEKSPITEWVVTEEEAIQYVVDYVASGAEVVSEDAEGFIIKAYEMTEDFSNATIKVFKKGALEDYKVLEREEEVLKVDAKEADMKVAEAEEAAEIEKAFSPIVEGVWVKTAEGFVGKVEGICGALVTVEHDGDIHAYNIEGLTVVEAPAQEATPEVETPEIPAVTEKEALVLNFLNKVHAHYEDDFSDTDVADIATGLELSKATVKGVVGSLVKKGLAWTYETDSQCLVTGEKIDFDLICVTAAYRNVEFKATKGAKLAKADKAPATPKTEGNVTEDEKYKTQSYAGEGWSYERTTDKKGNFVKATFIVKGEEVKLKSPSKKQVKMYLKEALGIDVVMK